MQLGTNAAVAVLTCGLAVCYARAQEPAQRGEIGSTGSLSANRSSRHKTDRPLSKAERRTVIATALKSKIPRRAERDCSHLVHTIYERAGFPYAYAPSDDLYDGVEGFQRVSRPQPADLVVWRGHAGIVIQPSRHQFFSFLSRGPGIDNYQSRYWRERGQPRFYRYIKNDS